MTCDTVEGDTRPGSMNNELTSWISLYPPPCPWSFFK